MLFKKKTVNPELEKYIAEFYIANEACGGAVLLDSCIMAEEEYVPPSPPMAAPASAHAEKMPFAAKAPLSDVSFTLDESFSEMLLRIIDEKGMKDSECYKKANIDRKLFSKIRSNPDYRPSKSTVIAFCIALELSLDKTGEMLKKAGFALSHSNLADVIVEYYIQKGEYDLIAINEALYSHDQPLI